MRKISSFLDKSGQGLTEAALLALMVSAIAVGASKCGQPGTSTLAIKTPVSCTGANGFPIANPVIASRCCYGNGNLRRPIPENCPKPLDDTVTRSAESGTENLRRATSLLNQSSALVSKMPEVPGP